MTSRGKISRLKTLIACCVASICGCNGADSVIGSATSNGEETRFAISDAATGGRRGFYFLPPLVKAPAYGGIFDGSLSPTVEICEYGASGCVATIATYSMTTEPGSDRIRVDGANQQYSVNWNTAEFSLDVHKTYRVRALLWSLELGSIDVDPVSSASELKTVDGSRFVALLNGTTLPIKFRLETSALWEGLAPLVLSRNSAPAGALVEMSGIAPTTVPLGELSLFIGGRPASVNATGTGGLLGGVPFFLDATGWPAPPPDAQSVVLLRNGIPIAGAKAALTITPLSDAPGSSQQALAALRSIASFFDDVAQPLAPGPSLEDAFLQSHRAALHAMLDGQGANSLASVLGQAAESPAARLLDAWFASSGVLGALQQFAALAQGTTFTTTARVAAPVAASGGGARMAALGVPPDGGSPSLASFALGGTVSDLELARQMQLYEVVRLFSQTVVAGTNATFSNYVGNAAGLLGLGLSAVMSSPSFAPAAIASFALAMTDFIANKVIVGLMPAGIQTFDLSVANAQLQTGELTDATLRVVAVNDPPTVSLNEFVGLFLSALGALPAPEAETLRQLMEGFASFYLNLLQSMLSQYASANPQLNLDVSLGHLVPALQWDATITDRRLVERKSQTPTIIDGDLVEVNWRASQTNTGQGRIYAVPSMGASAIMISPPAGIVYAGGAFGDDILSSNVVTVQVGDVNVTVNPGAVNLSPSGTQQFTATVTGNSNTAVTWTTDDPSGFVSNTGFYTAGSTTGIYSVTATSVADSTQKGAAAVTISPPSGVMVSGTNLSDTRSNCPRSVLTRFVRLDWGWTPLTNQTFATSAQCTTTTLDTTSVSEAANATSQYTVSTGIAGAMVITGTGSTTATGTVSKFINDTNWPQGTLQARVDNALQFTVTAPMTYQLTGSLIATSPTVLDGFQYKFGSAGVALVLAGSPTALVSVVGSVPLSSTGVLQPGTYILSFSLRAEVMLNVVLDATAIGGGSFTLRLTPP